MHYIYIFNDSYHYCDANFYLILEDNWYKFKIIFYIYYTYIIKEEKKIKIN